MALSGHCVSFYGSSLQLPYFMVISNRHCLILWLYLVTTSLYGSKCLLCLIRWLYLVMAHFTTHSMALFCHYVSFYGSILALSHSVALACHHDVWLRFILLIYILPPMYLAVSHSIPCCHCVWFYCSTHQYSNVKRVVIFQSCVT